MNVGPLYSTDTYHSILADDEVERLVEPTVVRFAVKNRARIGIEAVHLFLKFNGSSRKRVEWQLGALTLSSMKAVVELSYNAEHSEKRSKAIQSLTVPMS